MGDFRAFYLLKECYRKRERLIIQRKKDNWRRKVLEWKKIGFREGGSSGLQKIEGNFLHYNTFLAFKSEQTNWALGLCQQIVRDKTRGSQIVKSFECQPKEFRFPPADTALGAYVSSQRITQEQILEGDPNQVYKKKNHSQCNSGCIASCWAGISTGVVLDEGKRKMMDRVQVWDSGESGLESYCWIEVRLRGSYATFWASSAKWEEYSFPLEWML